MGTGQVEEEMGNSVIYSRVSNMADWGGADWRLLWS